MKYVEIAQEKIGENLIFIQDLIGLKHKHFYAALNASEPTLKKILLSKNQVYIDLYIQVAFLFGMRLEEIIDRTIKLPINFRETLLNYHKTIKSDAYEYLNQRPITSYAIKRLLNTDKLNEFKKAEKVKVEIRDLLGYDYDVSTLSATLAGFNQIISRQASNNSNHKEYKLDKPFTEKSTGSYIPSYIKLTQYLNQRIDLRNVEYDITFDSVFKMFEIIIQVSDKSKSGKELFLGFKKTSFNEINVRNYLTPLLNSGLVVTKDQKGSDDVMYGITDKGIDVLNLK
ncbi:hypothetical protein [Mucilaginibacter polytrichastri]|uniref:Uncharacterized protein n=1 Tax=Mucilaginibacter polytrichastri TaxID=1302689 RepID=A0A1Q5ZW87_9SPHI|nr:hypothetical protein [Mucilaginibacter polytrichastri]OKS86041.1 hypothetical protein RG47T_1488 [Mucilaginibacter polytrichastri]SFS59418.1 hypothetical protein SAMN04487890_10297 [Mucilaginibacter polytrichastri]